MGDGSPIVHERDKSFVHAIHKMMAGNSAKSNFITLSSHSLDYSSNSESDYYTSDTLIMAAQPTAAQPTILHGIAFNPNNNDTVMEGVV